MVAIRRIRQEETPAVIHLICRVAYGIFGYDGTLEESQQYYVSLGTFQDMEDVQAHYFDNGGLFLVALDRTDIVGSGALRRLDAHTAELKRMWLLEQYHGQGIGRRLLTVLLAFAREKGYTRMRLQTSPGQTRALAFYRKAGFYEIPCYNDDFDEISMELLL